MPIPPVAPLLPMRIDELAGGHAGECLKVMDEVGLVGVAEVLRQIGCSALWINEQHIANALEADDTCHRFGCDTCEIFEAPFKLACRKRYLGGEVFHTQLPAGIVQLLRRAADGV